MNFTGSTRISSLVDSAGMTIIHFLWQGAIVALMIAVLLALLDRRSARERYAVSLAGMAAMLAAPVITFLNLVSSGRAGEGGLAGGAGLPTVTGTFSLPGFVEPLLPWIAVVWLAGATSLQVRLVVQWVAVLQLRRSALCQAPAEWRAMVNDLRRRMGIDRVVRVAESALVSVPSVAGSFRPVILMPIGVMSALTPAMVRNVIAHELAHIRRHDYAINLLQNVLESLLFFHPAVWWLSRRMRQEREFCCDDIALSVCGSRMEYARALHKLDQLKLRNRAIVPAITGGSLMDRISRIAGIHTNGRRIHGAWLAPLIALMLFGTAWSAVRHGPEEIHFEGPEIVFPELETLKEDMFILQGDLDGLELSELEHMVELDELVGIREELVGNIEDIRINFLPSLRSLKGRASFFAAPGGISVLGDGVHFLDGDIDLRREYRDHSRQVLQLESMSVIEELLDGDISSKDAVKQMEALVKEFRASEAETKKLRKETMRERAEAEYEAELKAREYEKQEIEEQNKAAQKALERAKKELQKAKQSKNND